jgi:hypothetical protein
MDKFVDHPGGRRTTNNQYNIFSGAGKGIPKIIERRNKPRLCSIKPRKFIEENYFFWLLLLNIKSSNCSKAANQLSGVVFEAFG